MMATHARTDGRGRHRLHVPFVARHAAAPRQGGVVLRSWLPLLLIAALAVPLAGVWRTPPSAPTAAVAGLRLARDRGPAGPIEIESIDTTLVWGGVSQAEAVVALRNTTSSEVDAQVWWIVGRIGDPHPWIDPVLVSPVRTAALPAHEDLRVTIPSSRMPRDGTYTLSAWVHTKGHDGEFVPSDGVALAAALTVAADSRALTHGNSTDPTLQIVSAAVSVTSTDCWVDATVINTSLRARAVRISASIGEVKSTADAVVDSASSRSVSLRLVHCVPPSPGTPAVLSAGVLAPDGTVTPADLVSVSQPNG